MGRAAADDVELHRAGDKGRSEDELDEYYYYYYYDDDVWTWKGR